MTRQCERPDCAVRASTAYGFDARRRTAWFAPLAAVPGAEATTGALCTAHAQAMVLPRGWWLDDRRDTDSDRLFTDAGAGSGSDTDPEAARGGRRAKAASRADRTRRSKRRAPTPAGFVEVPLPLDDAPSVDPPSVDPQLDPPLDEALAPVESLAPVELVGVAEPSGDEATDEPERVVVPWRPRFDQTDDLGGVLAARSPLLARAFGGLRRSAPHPPRDE